MVEPVPGAYSPVGQGEHTELPTPEANVPLEQATHTVRPAVSW